MRVDDLQRPETQVTDRSELPNVDAGAKPGSSARASCILKHHCSSPYLMLLLNKEFTDLARLAGQRASGMLLFPP